MPESNHIPDESAQAYDSFRRLIRGNHQLDPSTEIAAYPTELHDELWGIALIESVREQLAERFIDGSSLGSLGPDAAPTSSGGSSALSAGEIRLSLGDFQLERLIGTGAMGRVYEASQLGMDRTVAVKVLTRAGTNREDFRERFRREANATADLNHPHIASAIAYGVADDVPWIAMKMVNGIPLDRIIQMMTDEKLCHADDAPEWCQLRNGARYTWIAIVAAQVASAVEHAHAKGVIHRDIKPSNIMIDEAGNAHVTDFGLSKIMAEDSDITRTGDVIGTPRYMAPEQANAIAEKRSDIYAIGITLWELASGRRAFGQGSKDVITLPAIRDVEPKIPEELAKIIDRCCEWDPDRRYQSASELLHVINRFIDDRQPADRRRTGGKRENGAPYHRYLPTILLTALILLAAWFAVVGLGKNASSPSQSVNPATSPSTLP